ncbi:MAG: hypothetical protein RLZZ218_1044 [Actinomycetota bacterium]
MVGEPRDKSTTNSAVSPRTITRIRVIGLAINHRNSLSMNPASLGSSLTVVLHEPSSEPFLFSLISKGTVANGTMANATAKAVLPNPHLWFTPVRAAVTA